MTSPTPAEVKLRLLLGEPIPVGGSDTDTYFTDVQITTLLTDATGIINRAAMEGWRMKAAYYADLVNVTEGNAMRQMSDLHKHALDMVKHYQASGNDLTTGRARVGRIQRRWF